MGFDLLGKDEEYFRFNSGGWEKVLRIAFDNGWVPKGTEPPCDFEGEWCGTYFSNDFQLVTPDDAAGIAAAMEKYLNSESFLNEARVSHLLAAIEAYFTERHLEEESDGLIMAIVWYRGENTPSSDPEWPAGLKGRVDKYLLSSRTLSREHCEGLRAVVNDCMSMAIPAGSDVRGYLEEFIRFLRCGSFVIS